MINAYVIAPKSLVLRVDNTPTLNPLAFSAAQLNKTTGLPYGLTAIDGKAYVGSPDELPVFVRYSDGSIEILDKPDSESVAYGDFVVSGMALLVSGNQPQSTTSAPHNLRACDNVKRVAIGILKDGNAFVVFCTAPLDKLKRMLCAYGAYSAILLASDDVYFSNPRNGISHGEQPVLSLQATLYEEVPTPVIAIDPAHGGIDLGNHTPTMNEKDLTLTIATRMKEYLTENYYGTFMLTRTDDVFIPLSSKIDFVDSIQADLVYTCHINALNGVTRGFECQCYSDTSDSVKALVDEIYTRIRREFSRQHITDNGLLPKRLKLFEMFHCPMFIAKTLYMDNAEDSHLLSKPNVLRMLAEVQAEALAQAMGLNKRTSTSKIEPLETKRFRVNVGEFPFKLGALELCEKLRQCGFDAYITKE